MATEAPIVVVEVPPRERTLIGMLIGRQQLPDIRAGAQLFVSFPSPDDKLEIRRMRKGESLDLPASMDNVLFYHIRPGDYPFCPTFSKVVDEWDCRIQGHFRMDDCERFLRYFAKDIISPNVPLTPSLAESWLADRIADNVRMAIKAETKQWSMTELRDKLVLPNSYWERQFAEWFADIGITVQGKVMFSNAQAEAAEAEAARRLNAKRMAEEKQGDRDRKIREATAKAEYQTKKRQIETNSQLHDLERAQQLQLLEEQHRIVLLKLKEEREATLHRIEKAAIEHQADLARFRRDPEAVKKAEEQESQAETRYQEVLKGIEDLRATVTKLAGFPDNLLAQLANRDEQKANAAAAGLTKPGSGISSFSLAELGYSTVDDWSSIPYRPTHVQFIPRGTRAEAINSASLIYCTAESHRHNIVISTGTSFGFGRDGSDPRVDIVLRPKSNDDPEAFRFISRFHFRINCENDGWILRLPDKAPANDLLVNDTIVRGPVTLNQPTNTVKLSGVMELWAECRSTSATTDLIEKKKSPIHLLAGQNLFNSCCIVRHESYGTREEEELYVLLVQSTTIGSDPRNDICIDGSGVAPLHALMVYSDQRLWIEPVGNHGIVRLNDNNLVPGVRTPLSYGDRLEIGNVKARIVPKRFLGQ